MGRADDLMAAERNDHRPNVTPACGLVVMETELKSSESGGGTNDTDGQDDKDSSKAV